MYFRNIKYFIIKNSHAGLNWNAVPTMVNAPNPPQPLDIEQRRKPPKTRQELPPKTRKTLYYVTG